ncbi:MAG: trans-aconitate 2-methyltransferase [Dongiaceae bacterium]
MPSWDPGQYLKFADHRLRPALDLMARIDVERPRAIHDLGCGPGNITRLLAERWPGAKVTGIDSSAEMLAKARSEVPDIEFQAGDIKDWRPPAPADIIFSNAALHWLADHEHLLPRLFRQLAPGGVLAIQMPRNHDAPSQVAISAAVANGPWPDELRNVRGILPVAAPSAYYRILSPVARHLDIWETEYMHVLAGENPVVEWTKGTALRPYLDALAEPERGEFLANYSARIAAAYPKDPDGCTLLPFRRIFVLART